MATSLCIPASWVLADSFDAVTVHEPMPIDFWEDEPEVSLITCPCCDAVV